MIKKLLAILILFIYLPAVAGVGFSTHYCGGEANQTKVFSFSKESCCSEDPEEDDCCSDQIKIVKLDNDQWANADKLNVKPSSALAFALPISQNVWAVQETYQKAITFSRDYPPLLSKNRPITYCSLLI
ncbi:MAG TPA: hypothetical protein VK177_08460 [Flavobacteriales bacterium]|nr:hypothetical protein [Flavobacteriales bacterium]